MKIAVIIVRVLMGLLFVFAFACRKHYRELSAPKARLS